MVKKVDSKRLAADSALKPRALPAQERSEKTVKLILETSAQLLGEVGLDGFNTNLLAERAELRIGTIYRYFPNKLAILSALVLKWSDIIKEEFSMTEALTDPNVKWQDVICGFIDAYTAAADKQAGFFAIRRAMQAAPELRAIEKSMVKELSGKFVTVLKIRGVQLEREELLTITEIFLMTGAAVYDLAWLKGRKNKALKAVIVEELKLLSTCYLANYLEKDLQTSSALKSLRA